MIIYRIYVLLLYNLLGQVMVNLPSEDQSKKH